MNDKAILDDLLLSLKGACDLYMHGTIESSTVDVHNTMNNTLFDYLQMQNEVYSQMEARGWYPQETVPLTKVQETLTQLQQQK